MASFSTKFFAFFMLSILGCASVQGQLLSETLYEKTCPTLVKIVHDQMEKAIKKENRIAASILRMVFHDCFVDGCNAGLLLDSDPSDNSEKTASPNANSLRGFEVIDAIKAEVEAKCQRTVSCADILVLAAREGVNLVGGPMWKVAFGRKDTLTADPEGADSFLPGPGSSLTQLVGLFQSRDFSPEEMVALSGAHTIGQAHCRFFSNRIQNDQNIDPSFANDLSQNCSKGDLLESIDYQSPESFDNKYYVNLVNQKGLFHSDQEIYNGATLTPADAEFLSQTRKKVEQYSKDGDTTFAAEFASAMEKLGNMIDLKSIETGEIRSNCHMVN
ncbi:hypothetical protein LUZ60_012330 [Juncus effusus]|nr:hypothetical protein LUZ60_012330 [Juncus effusus]